MTFLRFYFYIFQVTVFQTKSENKRCVFAKYGENKMFLNFKLQEDLISEVIFQIYIQLLPSVNPSRGSGFICMSVTNSFISSFLLV